MDGSGDWATKATLGGLGLAVGFTLSTWLVMRIEAATIARLRQQLTAPTGYAAPGGF